MLYGHRKVMANGLFQINSRLLKVPSSHCCRYCVDAAYEYYGRVTCSNYQSLWLQHRKRDWMVKIGSTVCGLKSYLRENVSIAPVHRQYDISFGLFISFEKRGAHAVWAMHYLFTSSSFPFCARVSVSERRIHVAKLRIFLWTHRNQYGMTNDLWNIDISILFHELILFKMTRRKVKTSILFWKMHGVCINMQGRVAKNTIDWEGRTRHWSNVWVSHYHFNPNHHGPIDKQCF